MSDRPGALADQLRLKGFVIERELGQGGMGVVYQATQISLGRAVAIEILHDGTEASTLARFRREALTLRTADHPNIVRILDLSLDTVPACLVLELVPGARALAEVLMDEPASLPVDLVARMGLVRGMLEGLSAVHELGIVPAI